MNSWSRELILLTNTYKEMGLSTLSIVFLTPSLSLDFVRHSKALVWTATLWELRNHNRKLSFRQNSPGICGPLFDSSNTPVKTSPFLNLSLLLARFAPQNLELFPRSLAWMGWLLHTRVSSWLHPRRPRIFYKFLSAL